MVLKSKIRILAGTFLFISLMIVFSCRDFLTIVNCSDCTSDEPPTAKVVMNFSPNYYNINVNIYDGNLEDSILYWSISSSSTQLSTSLPLNKTYSISAQYNTVGGSTYFVINSITPRVRYVTDQCNEPCYVVYDNTVNLRLKN
jgi:hypothetical protein